MNIVTGHPSPARMWSLRRELYTQDPNTIQGV